MRIFRFLFITNLVLFLSTTNVFSLVKIPESYKHRPTSFKQPSVGVNIRANGMISDRKFMNITIKSDCNLIFSLGRDNNNPQGFGSNIDDFYTQFDSNSRTMTFPTVTSLNDEIDIFEISKRSSYYGLSLVDVVYIPKTTKYVKLPISKTNKQDPSKTSYEATTFTLQGFFYVLEGLRNKDKYSMFQTFCRENEIPFIRGYRKGSYPILPDHGYNRIIRVPYEHVVTLPDLYPGTRFKYLGSLSDYLDKDGLKNFSDYWYGESPYSLEGYRPTDIGRYAYIDPDELSYTNGEITRYLIPTNIGDDKAEKLLDVLNVSRFVTPIDNTSSEIIIEYNNK